MKIKEAPGCVKRFRIQLLTAWLLIIPWFAAAEPLYSPTWGFSIDLPEGYEFTGGDGKNRFSFSSSIGAVFDLVAYGSGTYKSVKETMEDVKKRLQLPGDISYFDYHGKAAALMEMTITNPQNPLEGWCFCVELPGQGYLTALAYGPRDVKGLQSFHFSAIDSITPTDADRNSPGALAEFSYPRGEPRETSLAGGKFKAVIHEGDAEAAQATVDREFTVLAAYLDSPLWKEAWIRFYRAIYRDSYERLADISFEVERSLFLERREKSSGTETNTDDENRAFAEEALQWVQSFAYERDLMGSDFVNLVTAAVEGRGDCDSRAMLWAVLLQRSNIPAAIMVSRDYSHAMGLADLKGSGARFDLENKKWVVAETTAQVPLGLIGKNVSDPQYWLGITFE